MLKVCKNCQKSFIPTKEFKSYCSEDCRNKGYYYYKGKSNRKEYNRKYYSDNKGYYQKKWAEYSDQNREYLQEESRKRYWTWKRERYNHLRDINRKAVARKRYGVDDRKAFINSCGGKCEDCGSIYSLAIHHLDNNGRKAEIEGRTPNNNADNLVVLCAKCHIDHHIRGVALHLKKA